MTKAKAAKRGPGAPSKLTDEQWADARALYEAGATHEEVAAKYGISRSAVQKRAQQDGWVQDSEALIRRRVAEKVAQIPIAADPQKKAEAIDAEADRRVEVLDRHKREWANVQALQNQAIVLHQSAVSSALKDGAVVENGTINKTRAVEAFDLARFAKISAETTQIRHAGERRAIGMDTTEDDGRNVRVIVERKKKGE